MAELEVRARFTAAVGEAVASLKRLEAQLGRVQDTSAQTSGGMTRALGGIAKFGAGATAALGAVATAAGVMGIKTAAANEQAMISFETLLGSQQKAAKMFADLQQFAATTPFEFPQLRDAASKLLTTGVAAERVLPIMTALGDSTAAMGTGAEGIGRAVYALQQMNTAGRVTGQDMMQLAQAGIPVWDALAASIGKSVPETRKLAQEGAFVANDVMTAIETYAGPAMSRVKGMMEVQSQSMMGLMSTLKDTIAIELGKMMQPAADELKKVLPVLIQMVGETLTAIGPSINKMVAAIFGTMQRLLPLLTPIFIGIGDLITVAMEAISMGIEMVMPHLAQIGPMFKQIATTVRNLITAFAPLVGMLVATFVPIIVAAVSFVANLSQKLAGLAGVFSTLSPLIMVAVGGLIAYKVAMAAIGLASFIKMLLLNVKALWLSVGAQGALNTVTMLFPGVWIAAAIAGFVAAIYLLVKNWDWVVDKLKWAWNMIIDVVQAGINKILGWYEWWTNKTIDAVNLIIKAWNKLPFNKDIAPLQHVNFELDITGAKLERAAKESNYMSQGIGDAVRNAADLRNQMDATNNKLASINAKWDAMRMRSATGVTPGVVEKDIPTGGGSGVNKVVEAAKKRLDELKSMMEKVSDTAKDFGQNVGSAVQDALGVKTVFSADKASGALAGLRNQIASAKKITPGLVNQFNEFTKTVGDQMVKALKEAQDALQQAKDRFEQFRKSIADSIVRTFGTLNDAYGKVTQSQKDLTAAQKASADAQKRVNELLSDPDADPSRLAEAYDELKIAQEAEMKAGSEASKSFVDRLREQAAAGQAFSEQVRKLISMGMSESALKQVLEAGVEAGSAIATELINGGQSVIDETNRLIASAESAADQVGIMAAQRWYQAGIDNATAQVNGVIAQINKLTPEIMNVMDELAKKMEREATIKIKVSQNKFDVDVFVTKHIREVVTRNVLTIGSGDRVDGYRAQGGPVMAGGTYVVGEQGPELFTPNRGGSITPNGAMGNVNITVNAGMGANGAEIGDQIVDALKRYQRRNGPLPITTV